MNQQNMYYGKPVKKDDKTVFGIFFTSMAFIVLLLSLVACKSFLL